jgi:hypothetical protein
LSGKGEDMKKIVCGLLFCSVVTCVFAKEDINIEAKRFIETVAKERIVSCWKGASPKSPVVYLNSKLNPELLCFEVQKWWRPLGFLMVSVKNAEVVEFSTLAPPHKREIWLAKERARESVGEGRMLGREKFIWLGPSLYLISFPIVGSDKRITIDIRTLQVVDSRIFPNLEKISTYSLNKSNESKIITMASHKLYISDITTSLANLIFYYQEKEALKTNLSFKEIADGLSNAGCDCEPIKTTNKFLAALGYKAEGSVLPYSFLDYKNEINEDRPVLVKIKAQGLEHTLLGAGFWGNYLSLVDQLSLEYSKANDISFYKMKADKIEMVRLKIDSVK